MTDGSLPPGTEDLSYERALELLDQTLAAIEDGNLPLEEVLDAVDRARAYLLVCERRLEEAKRRIEVRPEGGAPPP